MQRQNSRTRLVLCLAAAAAGVSLAGGAAEALAGPFTTQYLDGTAWNTIYGQGFSPSLTPTPDPGLAPTDDVLLDQFQFFKSGSVDSAADIKLVILNNLFTNLNGLTTSSGAVVGVSNNTIASTAGLNDGDALTFDFDNLSLNYGDNYGAIFANIGAGGEITPVLVSAQVASYQEVAPGDWHPVTNYGTEEQWQYTVTNWINAGAEGSYFGGWSYSADARFIASLLTPPVGGSTWALAGSGAWGAATSWTGGVPNAVGASATFGGTTAATVDTDIPVTVGTITFDNAAGYTVSPTNSVTLDVASGAAAINVVTGSHAIQAALSLADNTTVSVAPAASTLTVTNLQPSPAVTLTKTGAGTLAVNNVRAAGLAVDAGTVAVLPNGAAAGASRVSSLTVGASAKLDLTNNKLVVAGAGSAGAFNTTTGQYAGINGLVASGRNGGTWDGPGIITTQTHADTGLTALAVARASETPYAGTTFAGQNVAADDVLVMYTYGGDADLSGTLDSDDYFAIDSNFNLNGSVFGWTKGDFDYNGAIDSDDYFIIDSNWNNQILGAFSGSAGAGDAVTAVPEPAAACVFAFAGAALLARRHRQRD